MIPTVVHRSVPATTSAEVEAFWEGEYEDAVADERQPCSNEVHRRIIAKVRSALLALGEE